MKNKLKQFFLHNKVGIAIIASMAILNTFEGVVHLIVSGWGLVDTNTYDWRTWVAPIENLIFGVFSILTGYALGMKHEHGHDVKFKLNDKFSKQDPLGEGYVYTMTDHPENDNLRIIHYKNNEKWFTTFYKVDEVKTKFDKGLWIKV